MAEQPLNSAVLVFDEFLAYLRQQGFIIGVDHYLRLQNLLNRISGECSPGELSTLLCPIFATSASQQQKFYKAFGAFFTSLQSVPAFPRGGAEDEQQSARAYGEVEQSPARGQWMKAAGLAFLAVLVTAVLWVISPVSPNQNANINNRNTNDNANQSIINNAGNRNERINNTNERPSGNKNSNPVPDPPPEPATRPNVSAASPPPLLGSSVRALIRTGATLGPLLIFLIYEYLRYKRRKLVL